MSQERVDPPLVADETTMLLTWLDRYRETLAHRVSGVDPARLGEATVAPSTLTLLGLVRHVADNERYWFREVVAGEEARVVIAGRSMDDVCATELPAGPGPVRWVVVHVLEEYARRWGCVGGHADLLRERLDGVVGVYSWAR